MLKNLFNFKGSKKLVLGRVILLVCLAAAFVVFAFGVKEILDVKHMKQVLDVTRPLMGDVLSYLAKKYLIWVGLALVIGFGSFLTLRYQDNKEMAAA